MVLKFNVFNERNTIYYIRSSILSEHIIFYSNKLSHYKLISKYQCLPLIIF